jgi:hypothetical protein
MHLLKLPYLTSRLETGKGHETLQRHFMTLLRRDPEQVKRLVQSMIAHRRAGHVNPSVFVNADDFLQKFAAHSVSEGYHIVDVVMKCESNNYSIYIGDVRDMHNLAKDCEDFDVVDEYLRNERFDLITCDDCGQLEHCDESQSVGNDAICRECIDDRYVWSEYSDEYIRRCDAVIATDQYGGETWIDGDNPPDSFNYDEDEERYVHEDYSPPILGDYHQSKNSQEPIDDKWTATYGRHMGVELEVEVADGDRKAIVNRLHEKINNGDIGHRVFFEKDGSLRNGFEIITQPMSLPMIAETFGFLNDSRLVNGLKSHNTETCGLHVHVSRRGMTNLQISKMVCFVNDAENRWLIEAIARRYSNGFCRIHPKKLGNAYVSMDRYEAINLTNRRTIEFRIFRGTLKYDAVVAAAQFVHALVEFTRPAESSLKSLNAAGFLNFVQKKMPKECATFLRYIGERSKQNQIAA